MKKVFALLAQSAWFLPALAFAQGPQVPSGTGIQDSGGFLDIIGNILSSLIPILITIGVVMFIVGVLQYVIGKTDEAKTKGRDMMLWSIGGLFVILALWGIIAIIGATFNVGIGGTVGDQQIPGVDLN